MGVIGDAFGALFSFLGGFFSGIFGFLGDFASFLGTVFKNLFSFLGDIFKKLFGVLWDVIKWVGSLLKKLFQNLLDVLIGFFKVIYALIDGFLYLLYMIGVVAVKLFMVIFETAKLLWSLAVGFAKTLASLVYTPTGGSGHGYSSTIGKLFKILEPMQINAVAYILLFMLWFITAITAMKLISSIRVGGD